MISQPLRQIDAGKQLTRFSHISIPYEEEEPQWSTCKRESARNTSFKDTKRLPNFDESSQLSSDHVLLNTFFSFTEQAHIERQNKVDAHTDENTRRRRDMSVEDFSNDPPSKSIRPRHSPEGNLLNHNSRCSQDGQQTNKKAKLPMNNFPISNDFSSSKTQKSCEHRLSCTTKSCSFNSSNIINNPSSNRRLTRSQTTNLKNNHDEPHKLDSKKLQKLVRSKRLSQSKRKSAQQKNPTHIKAIDIKPCVICFGTPENEDHLFGVLPCSHQFCLTCILSWSEVTNKCPLCRMEFLIILRQNHCNSSSRIPLSSSTQIIKVAPKQQRISEDEEFYWEEGEENLYDQMCYICMTDQEENKLIICDNCGVRICHTYCDDDLLDDSVPTDDWFCHDCRENIDE